MPTRAHINNTPVYSGLADYGDGEYTVRAAHTTEEDKHLIEAGLDTLLKEPCMHGKRSPTIVETFPTDPYFFFMNACR